MFKIFGLIITTILSATVANAQQVGQIYLSPVNPSSYSTTDNSQIQILDTPIQNELVQYTIHRQRMQEANFVHMADGLTQNDSFVFRRIFDRSISRLLKSDYFKKTSVGRTSESMKKNMETNVDYVDATSNIRHKFDFKIAAFQQQAFIQYSGYMNAQLAYNMNDGALALIYRKDISRNKFLGLQNTFSGPNAGQYLTFNYNW